MTIAQTQAIANVMSRGKWAKRITEAWQKQLPSIFEVASLLESAKTELRHGDWAKMIKSDLPFSQSTANKLMKIGACEHLRNSERVPNLPAHWGTLFELTLLTTEQFEHGITTATINPKMQRKDVRALRGDGQMPHEPRVSPMALLKRQLNERIQEIAHLQETLAYADQGSLFDLKKDSTKDMAAVVVNTITETKANRRGHLDCGRTRRLPLRFDRRLDIVGESISSGLPVGNRCSARIDRGVSSHHRTRRRRAAGRDHARRPQC